MPCSPVGGDRRAFLFGLGYTSEALAQTLQYQGWAVAGTCRTPEKLAALEARGLRAHLFHPGLHGLPDDALQELREASHVVSSIPPVGLSDPVLDYCHRREIVLPRWTGYLSSTSVYGDWHGRWVDELTPPRPVASRAVARWEAEKQWMALALAAALPTAAASCVRIFRLGGIYGPGRSALDTIRSRGPSSPRQRLREQKQFTSRVHVADICRVLVTAMTGECSPGSRVYNVVDDDPSPRAAVMAYARHLLNVEDDNDEYPSEVSSSFASNGPVPEKRVSNRRVKAELQVELLYPSFRSGLEAIVVASNHPFEGRESTTFP